MKKNDLSIGDIIRYKAAYGDRRECYGIVKEYNFHTIQGAFSVLWFDDAGDDGNKQTMVIRPFYLHSIDRGVTWFKES